MYTDLLAIMTNLDTKTSQSTLRSTPACQIWWRPVYFVAA